MNQIHHHQEEYPPVRHHGLKKGPWSAGEDKILMEYVRENGEGNWNAVQRNTPLQRCGKSCRLRWANHLRPNLKKGAFSHHEERLIIDLHSSLGNKWARISAHLPGRTDNEVKNYWNTRVKRRLRQGLPLYPHNPLTPRCIPSSPPPLPMSLSHLKTQSLFDPSTLPFPLPFFSFNQPIFLPALSIPMDLEPPDPLVFEPELELPSNQIAEHESVYDDYEYSPGRNSGLLDALLQEAESKSAAKEVVKTDCLNEDQWDSVFGNSFCHDKDDEVKMEEEDEQSLYYTNEDLSSILNLVVAPKWKDGRQNSAAQSTKYLRGQCRAG